MIGTPGLAFSEVPPLARTVSVLLVSRDTLSDSRPDGQTRIFPAYALPLLWTRTRVEKYTPLPAVGRIGIEKVVVTSSFLAETPRRMALAPLPAGTWVSLPLPGLTENATPEPVVVQAPPVCAAPHPLCVVRWKLSYTLRLPAVSCEAETPVAPNPMATATGALVIMAPKAMIAARRPRPPPGRRLLVAATKGRGRFVDCEWARARRGLRTDFVEGSVLGTREDSSLWRANVIVPPEM